MKILAELLTLADRKEYYENGATPWPKAWQEKTPDGKPRSQAENKANDNFKRLLRENDRLYANQQELRRDLRRVIVIAAICVIASWSPLWLPLLLKLAK